MGFFENYNNRQNVTSSLDNALEGVETRIDSVQDQLSALGNAAQMTPLINDLRTIIDYMNQLKQSTGPELTEGFLNFKSGVESFLNTINNSNISGLNNVKDTVNEIYKTLQDISNLSSINQLIDGIDKLSNLLDNVSSKSANFKDIINNVNSNSISNDLQESLTVVDNFISNMPNKFQELKNNIQQSVTLDTNNVTLNLENTIEEMKSKMNDFASYISDNLKIGERLINQLDSSDEVVIRLKDSISSTIEVLQNGLDSISFDEQNRRVQYLIDNIGRINESSFNEFNQNLNLSSEVVNSLNENFSKMFDNIQKNNQSVESLSDIINQLNNGNSIDFNTNIKEIIRDAENAKDVIKSLNNNDTNVNPSIAIEQYEKIKNANEEMKKIKEEIIGVSVNSNNGFALSELLQSSGKDGTGVYYSEVQNNDILINSAQHLQDALSQYGDTYKTIVDSLDNQINELEKEKERLTNITNREKVNIPKELRNVLHDTNNEYTQMVNFQLLGNRKSIQGNNINYLTNGINNVGNDAIRIENNVRKYKRDIKSNYSGITEDDLKNTDKAFKNKSLDNIVDQSKDLQRLVHEFNKHKSELIDGVKKAVSTGAKDDIENAKSDMLALLEFSEDLLTQTKVIGDAITVKSLKQFETLPDQVKNIIGDIQNLVGHTQDMVYDTTDLADAFGLNTDRVRQLNSELEHTQQKITDTSSASEKMLASLSGGWKTFNNIIGKTVRMASMIGIQGLTLGSFFSDTFKYSRDRGEMAAESYRADISLGAQFNEDKAFDRNYNKALQYYSASHGLIDFDKYNDSYIGLSRNVGGRVGNTGQQTIEDLTAINENTFALSKVYGISDSTIQQATKTFYQDFGMTAKETSNMINEMVQAARSANVPIDKYVSQMSSLASSYRQIGLNGKDAQNIMNNMILSGMNVDVAFGFSQGAGRAVDTFSSNRSLNAYFGVLSGQYSNPFDAIMGGIDKYDENGNLRDGYIDKMTSTMDTTLSLYAGLGQAGTSNQKMILYDTFVNQMGMDKNNADIAVDKYLNDKQGFKEWFKDYELTQGSEEIIRVEGQDELLQKIEGISNQLDETQKINALRKEEAYKLSTVAESLGDTYLAPLRESIDVLTDKISSLIMKLGNGFMENSSLIGGIVALGGTAFLGNKLYKGGKNLLNNLGIKSNTISDGGKIADDIILDGVKSSKMPIGKTLAKGGLAALAGYGLYKAYDIGSGLFTFDNNNHFDNNNYIDKNSYYPNNQQYSYNNSFKQSEYESYTNYSIGSGKENDSLNLANLGITIGGDYFGSKLLGETLTKTFGKSTVGNVLGYGVGDVLYGVGTLAQHKIQGDYVSGDVQKSLSEIIMGGGGSALGAGIGSFFGPMGTFAGGLIGGLGTSLLDIVKLENGKGLGTTITDGVSVALGGSASEELEYKRAVINNPEELLRHRNEMLGISQEQSYQIDNTMETHAKELSHLTDEQKDAMKALCAQLMDSGETVNQAFSELSELFSKQNVEDTMNKLSDSIKYAIENAKLPEGWSEKDINTIANAGNKAIEDAKIEKLNSGNYVSSILSKNNVSYDKIKDLKLLGSSGWEKAYNNEYDENHDLAVQLIDDWMKKDLDKAAKKAKEETEKQIAKRNKQEKNEKLMAESKREMEIKEVVTNEIFSDDTSLLKSYLNKQINDSKKSLNNLKIAGKGENDFEYDQVSNELLGYQSYLEYLKEVDKHTNIAKKNFANGENEVTTKNIFGFNKTKKYKKEEDYINAYLESLNLEAKGILNTTVYGDNLKVNARDYITESIKSGSNSEIYKNNSNIQKIIDEQNKNSEESRIKMDKSLGIQDNTLAGLLVSNTTTSNILKTLGTTNESIEELSKTMTNMGTIPNSSSVNGDYNYFKYSGTNAGELQNNIFQTALIDTAANVKNYNGDEGQKLMNEDANKINEFFKGKKMEGYGMAYVEAASKYGVDPMLLASITHAEYGGNPGETNNVGGIRKSSNGNENIIPGSAYASYSSIENGILDLARIIKEVYYDKGLTSISEIKSVYCPDDDPTDVNGLNGHWVKNVSGAYSKMNNSSLNYLATSDSKSKSEQLYSGNYQQSQNLNHVGNISGNNAGSVLADIAMSQVGTPYIWGAEGSVDWDGDGDTRAGYDCSGLVTYAAHMAGISVGRLTAAGLYQKCSKISKSELRKGDLGFTQQPNGSISHVGIYCGDGKWVHAPQAGENIKIASEAGFNVYGRLPGSNGDAADVDISQLVPSGNNGGGSSSGIQSAYDSVMSSDLFSKGSMLYGIVPSDYSSNFTNDSTQRTNYAQLITDAFAESGGNGLANTIYSQNHSRMARLNWEAYAGIDSNNIYKDVINTASKNAENSKKTYNVNVKLDSNTGDSKMEKQIQSILQDALNKIENLGVSVSSLEDSVSLLDQSLYSVRGG